MGPVVMPKRSTEPQGYAPSGNWPEYMPDKGCELAPACLGCHLPRCRFDKVDGKRWRHRPKGIPNRRKPGHINLSESPKVEVKTP